MCLSQSRTWISNVIYRGPFYLFIETRWETIVCCVDIGRIDVNHCFNISEININYHSQNFCNSYQHFHDRWSLLTRKLSHQGFLLAMLKSSHKLAVCDRGFAQCVVALSFFVANHWMCSKSNTTGVESGTETAYPDFISDLCLFVWFFNGGLCCSILSFLCNHGGSVFVCLSLFVLYCLYFFNLRVLINPLVSSSVSF